MRIHVIRIASLLLLSLVAIGATGCPRDHDEQWHRDHPEPHDDQWRRDHPEHPDEHHDDQWRRDHPDAPR